jgi:hypothetical protein
LIVWHGGPRSMATPAVSATRRHGSHRPTRGELAAPSRKAGHDCSVIAGRSPSNARVSATAADFDRSRQVVGARGSEAHRADHLCGQEPTAKARIARWADAESTPAARLSRSDLGVFSDLGSRRRAGPSSCQTTRVDVV